MSVRRASLVLAIGAALLGTAAHALAQPAQPQEAVQLAYHAPTGCPTQDALEAAIAARTPAVRFTGDASTRAFVITIAPSGHGSRGTLAVHDGGDSSSRQLTAPHCDELMAALALITALAIDPQAALGVVVAPDGAPPVPPRDLTAPALPVLPSPPPPPVTRIVEAPPPPTVLARAWQAALVGSGEVTSGVSPDALLAAEVEGRLMRTGLGHLDLAGQLGRDTAEAAMGAARFTWLAARASACWSALARPIAVDVCGHVESGSLTATGLDIVNAQSSSRWWIAAGGHALVRWPVSARTFIEVQAGLSVPLRRDRFLFNPDIEIHETAAVTAWTAIGVGVRIW